MRLQGALSSFKPILATKRSDAVYVVLEQLITSAQILPGSRLPPERDIASELGVSRNSVREAIRELELKQLVQRRSGRGTVVLGMVSDARGALLDDLAASERDVREIMDFRMTIEPPIAGHAAARRTPSSLLHLSRLLDDMEHETRREQFARLDREFHDAVALATHNRLLVRLNQVTAEWMRHSRSEALQSHHRRAVALDGHRRIYVAIRDGDVEAARLAMAAHVQQVREIIERRSRSGGR